MNASATASVTITRLTPRQDCPAVANAPSAASFADWSRSASSSTMSGSLPPSSSSSLCPAAAAATARPAATEPVKVTMSTSGWPARAGPTVCGSPVTTASMSPGNPASRSSSAKARPVRGVFSDGLSTTAQPAATAGASLTTTWFSGRLNGVIAATTPTGSGTVTASLSCPGTGIASPRCRSASAAATRRLAQARDTSRIVSWRHTPDSAVLRAANSSVRSSSCAAQRASTSARCAAGRTRRRVATDVTARSTSAAESRATEPSGAPVQRSRTGRTSPCVLRIPSMSTSAPLAHSPSVRTTKRDSNSEIRE